MRVVVQRVNYAKCHIDGKVYSEINKGFMILVGIKDSDSEKEVEKVAKKVIGLRIFEDEGGKMNLDLNKVNGSVLSISQFTLYADCKKGNRPSFTKAKSAQEADRLYRYFNKLLSDGGLEVKAGIFQSYMQIEIVNDGPVTIIIDSEEL